MLKLAGHSGHVTRSYFSIHNKISAGPTCPRPTSSTWKISHSHHRAYLNIHISIKGI